MPHIHTNNEDALREAVPVAEAINAAWGREMIPVPEAPEVSLANRVAALEKALTDKDEAGKDGDE